MIALYLWWRLHQNFIKQEKKKKSNFVFVLINNYWWCIFKRWLFKEIILWNIQVISSNFGMSPFHLVLIWNISKNNKLAFQIFYYYECSLRTALILQPSPFSIKIKRNFYIWNQFIRKTSIFSLIQLEFQTIFLHFLNSSNFLSLA